MLRPPLAGDALELSEDGRLLLRLRHHAWADLLRRTFELDILDCPPFAKATNGKPDCGGRLRLLATIKQREVIERILIYSGLPTDPVVPAPARHEEELFA